MARSKIPRPLDRRHLLQRELDPVKAQGIADAYLEAGRTVEAADFLAKAKNTDELERLLAESVAEGDAFLLKAVCSALGVSPGAERWKQLAAAAEAAGKHAYAETARRHAEIDEG